MSSLHETKNFTEAVDQSFLSAADKNTLKAEAERGVDQALWSRFNDLLIAWLVENQARQRKTNEHLDEEINRYTGAYEKEKTKIDQEYRPALEEATRRGESSDSGTWAEYRQKIRSLQSRLLKDVKGTSATVLREVVMTTIGIGE